MQEQSALVMETLKQFRIIFNSVKSHFQLIEHDCQISGSQLWALSKLHEQPGLRVTELAKLLAIHQSTASNLVEQLVNKNLAYRQRCEDDQRSVRLHLTEAGNEVVLRAPRPFNGILPDALEKLQPGDLGALNDNLSKLIENIAAKSERAANIPLSDL